MSKTETIFNILLFLFLIFVTIYSFGTGMYIFGILFLIFIIWIISSIKIIDEGFVITPTKVFDLNKEAKTK